MGFINLSNFKKMKQKIRLTVEQFFYLTKYINNKIYNDTFLIDCFLSQIEILNLKLFLKTSLKQCIDLQLLIKINPTKLKTFSIEFNQLHCIYELMGLDDDLDSYQICIYEDIKKQRNTFKLIS